MKIIFDRILERALEKINSTPQWVPISWVYWPQNSADTNGETELRNQGVFRVSSHKQLTRLSCLLPADQIASNKCDMKTSADQWSVWLLLEGFRLLWECWLSSSVKRPLIPYCVFYLYSVSPNEVIITSHGLCQQTINNPNQLGPKA